MTKVKSVSVAAEKTAKKEIDHFTRVAEVIHKVYEPVIMQQLSTTISGRKNSACILKPTS